MNTGRPEAGAHYAALYNTAQSELAALREELATSNKVGTAIGETLGRVTAERDDLHKRLTAAEQRNVAFEELMLLAFNSGEMTGWWCDRYATLLKPTESGASE